MNNNKFYNLKNIKKRMKNEFGDRFKIPDDNELTYELLYVILNNIYTELGPDYVKATKAECELSLSEIDDNLKMDTSFALLVLILSLLNTAAITVMSFYQIVKTDGIPAIKNSVIIILLSVFLICALLLINELKKGHELKKLKLDRQYLKFKLYCIS